MNTKMKMFGLVCMAIVLVLMTTASVPAPAATYPTHCPKDWQETVTVYRDTGTPYCSAPGGDLLQNQQEKHVTTYHTWWMDWFGKCHEKIVVKSTSWHAAGAVVEQEDSASCLVKYNVTVGMLGPSTYACTMEADLGYGFQPIMTADQQKVFVKVVEQHDVTVQDGSVVKMMSLCSFDLYGDFWPLDVTKYRARDVADNSLVGKVIKGSWDNDYWAWTTYLP